jgi:ribosomal protein L34E
MAKKRKQNLPPRRKRMKRPQRLESAKSWLETYEGNKVVKAYRKRYGVDHNCAFTELEMLGVPIDPDYKERVLESVAVRATAKRQERARERARRADVWVEYADDDTALERAGECVSCDMFRPLDDLGLCPVCTTMLERDLIRQRDWEYAASTAFLSDEGREALRRKVVTEYGEGLELIDPA